MKPIKLKVITDGVIRDQEYILSLATGESENILATGIKVRGVELYEGDIVEFHANYTNKQCGWLDGVIVWDNERYRWALNAENVLYDIYDETEGFEYSAKRVGNIHGTYLSGK